MFVFVQNVYEYVQCFPIRSQNKNAITFNVYTNLSNFHWKAFFYVVWTFLYPCQNVLHIVPDCLNKKTKCHRIVEELLYLYLSEKKAYFTVFELFCLCAKMSCKLYQIVQINDNVSHITPCRGVTLLLSEKKNPISQFLNLFVSVPKCLAYCTRLSKKVTKCLYIVEL